MKKLSLKWEKWKDPYGENIEDVEWPGYKVPVEKQGYSDSYDTKFEERELEPTEFLPPARPLKFIATSMGAIPLTEYTTPSKIFNFWVGHTSFDITNNIFDIIESVDGVEILDLFTRYRFRVGIGHVFKPGEVMSNIKKAVYKHIKEKNGPISNKVT